MLTLPFPTCALPEVEMALVTLCVVATTLGLEASHCWATVAVGAPLCAGSTRCHYQTQQPHVSNPKAVCIPLDFRTYLPLLGSAMLAMGAGTAQLPQRTTRVSACT